MGAADTTPAWLAEEMVRRAEVTPYMKVLDPCTGSGAIPRALRKLHSDCAPVCVDRDYGAIVDLKRSGFAALHADLYRISVQRLNGPYDCVIMHPPWDGLGLVHRAMDFLTPGGRLVSLVDPTCRDPAHGQHDSWRKLVEGRAGTACLYDLPGDCFMWNNQPQPAATLVIDL